jgi:hypothetical protein
LTDQGGRKGCVLAPETYSVRECEEVYVRPRLSTRVGRGMKHQG